jgi:hypothetical protein
MMITRMEQRVKNALNEYEVSLKEELNLRTIIPGVKDQDSKENNSLMQCIYN